MLMRLRNCSPTHFFLSESLAYAGRIALLLLVLFGNVPIRADSPLSIDISGHGSNALPILVSDFTGNAQLADDIASVLREDLESSDAFPLIKTDGVSTRSPAPQLPWEAWKSAGADIVLAGNVEQAGGRGLPRLTRAVRRSGRRSISGNRIPRAPARNPCRTSRKSSKLAAGRSRHRSGCANGRLV